MDERDAEEAYFDAALDAAEAEEGDRLANAHELGVCDEERCQWCTTAGLVDLTLIPEPHTSAPAVQLQFMVDDVSVWERAISEQLRKAQRWRIGSLKVVPVVVEEVTAEIVHANNLDDEEGDSDETT